MKTQRLFALVPVALFIACGGSSEFNSNRTSPSIPLDELPASYAGAQCELFERCATIYYDILFSLEDCKTLLEQQVRQGGFVEIEQAIEDGRVSYDAKKAQACIDAIGAIECSHINDRPVPACDDVLKGSLASGSECDLDEECATGLICDANATCPGQCAPLLAEGSQCGEDDECRSGLTCSDLTGRCVTPRAEGESCGGGIDPECDGGLACLGDNAEEMRTGTCTPFDEIELVGVDETCNLEAGILCESGLSCVLVELAGAVFACRSIPASGGNCGIGFPENCPRGEYCPLTGEQVIANTLVANCAPLPEDGAPCATRPINVLPSCEAYARCDTTTGNCVGLRDLGESCGDDRFCYSGNCVNGGCAAERACE